MQSQLGCKVECAAVLKQQGAAVCILSVTHRVSNRMKI